MQLRVVVRHARASCAAPHSPGLRAQVDAIVFLVDAVDKERFPESKKELDGLLSDDSLATVPFMVLGNKIDIPHAASEARAPWCRFRARSSAHLCLPTAG